MLRNYLTIALRNLRRHPGYTAINVLGLAVGMAVCLVIALYIGNELRYDRFHEKEERIYRVVQAEPVGDAFGPSSVRMLEGNVQTPPGLVPALKLHLPGIEQAVIVDTEGDRLLGHGDERVYAGRVLNTDAAFFEVFSFDLLRGDPVTALAAPGRIVLTASLAERLFGDESPIGRILVYENETEYEVTGVVGDPPSTSHLRFEAIRSLTAAEREMHYGSTVHWPYYAASLYLLLDHETDSGVLEAAIREFERAAEKPEWMAGQARLRLQPLDHIHLYSTGLSGGAGPQGDVRYLYFFGLVGALILGIACINYVNLATARAVARAREVGVRKVVGAGRLQLIGQFLGESTLMVAFALPLAVGVVHLALPVVNDVANTALQLRDVPLAVGFAATLGLVGLVGLGAGSYPAFVLARYRPAEVLPGARGGVSDGHFAWFRKGLVAFQFAASFALILATLVVYLQLEYIQEKQLGFDKERVITFERSPLEDHYAAFKEALEHHPSVMAVSAGPPVGVGHKNMTVPVEDEAAGTEERVSALFVDYGFPETLRIERLRGRTFTPERPGDVDRAVLLTERAVAAYGLEGDPVGQSIPWRSEQREVVGVVEDFHNESLHDSIQPVVLLLDPESAWTTLVRLAPDATRDGLDAVRASWERFLPDRPFTFEFLDRRIETQYRAEQRLAILFALFAGLAIFVAGLGLFGFAAYTAQQRTKEIGIRKALGASIASIVGLLSKEFLTLVTGAFAVAAPLAYWALQRWLQDFAFRVEIGANVFVVVGAAALAVVLAAVGYHALRAAHTDPATALRDA